MVKDPVQVGYLLKQAQSLLRVRMEEALEPLSLTLSQYSCLYRLRSEPGISSAALARATFMTRQSMGALLQQLLDRRLVQRPASVARGRALPTQLTATGEATLDAAEALVKTVEDRMLSGLSEPQRRALGTGLAACVEALSVVQGSSS